MPTSQKPPSTPPIKKEPLLKAAALKYNTQNASVPVLTAKGQGTIAEKIIALAEEHNIPIRSDADLITILEKLELEQEIPLEIYAVVAEIFSYIYTLQKKHTL